MRAFSFANTKLRLKPNTAAQIRGLWLFVYIIQCFIASQVENFRLEKAKFDQEVAKWDDTGNDIIVLAKHMCMIMMEMTDFTRWVDSHS